MKIVTQTARKIFGSLNANDNKGVTAIEYGLIAALVALVIVAGASSLGTKLSTMFSNIGDTVGGVQTKIGSGS